MRKLFPDSKRIFATSTNTQISRSPGKLHTVYRRLRIHIHRHTNATQQWHRPSHNLLKQTIPWITTKLGNTHQGSLCNLHVSENTQFLHRHSQDSSKKQPSPIKEISGKEHLKLKTEQLGS